MKKCIFIDNEIIEVTAEILAELESTKPNIAITDKDRLSALENAIADLAILLANNENIKEE